MELKAQRNEIKTSIRVTHAGVSNGLLVTLNLSQTTSCKAGRTCHEHIKLLHAAKPVKAELNDSPIDLVISI